MEWQLIFALFGSFAVLLTLGIPVSFAIGLSSLITIMMSLPLEPSHCRCSAENGGRIR